MRIIVGGKHSKNGFPNVFRLRIIKTRTERVTGGPGPGGRPGTGTEATYRMRNAPCGRPVGAAIASTLENPHFCMLLCIGPCPGKSLHSQTVDHNYSDGVLLRWLYVYVCLFQVVNLMVEVHCS